MDAEQALADFEAAKEEVLGHHQALSTWALEAVAERDRMRRLFNRLEAAVSHHKRAQDGFADDYDVALYDARDKILRDYAEGRG